MTEQERIAAFEPVRAVVRPRGCDERDGCWVKVGARGCSPSAGAGVKCLACASPVLFAGYEAAHSAALRRVLVELNTPK